jgi:hypothetical protein
VRELRIPSGPAARGLKRRPLAPDLVRMNANGDDRTGDDALLARLRERVADGARRVDERGDAMTDMLGALPLDQLFDMVREGGAALRGLVASHTSGTAAEMPRPTPSGALMIGGFDVVGMTRLMATPVDVVQRPPATADAVARAEAALGLRLPALLVRVYTEVADGGFGPGAGLLPLFERTTSRTQSLVEAYESNCEASEHGYGAPWPRHLVPIAMWTDGAQAVVDTADPRHPVREVDLADLEDEDDAPWECEPVAPTLAEWLRRWVDA